MRLGVNPQKKDFLVELNANHRVVVVVFIPELAGYYKNMFEVVKLSLKSLIQTIPPTTKITVVDNGSCAVVQTYLMAMFENKEIDALNLLSENIGKIDAILAAARGSREPLITVTDCDILFRSKWVSKTIEIFNVFQNVSSVSPIPTRKAFNYYTYSTKEAILRKRISLDFLPVPENKDDFNLFLGSINWGKDSTEKDLWPIVRFKEGKAILGSDHQVLTVRRDIFFNNSPFKPSFIKVGNKSEETYIDLAIDSSGGLRLSTFNFYAMHMGNEVESWMLEEIDKNEIDDKAIELTLSPKLHYISKSKFWYKIKKQLIKRILRVKVPPNFI